MPKRALITGNRKATNAKRGADMYPTPYQALAVLLDAESTQLEDLAIDGNTIWEPACGNGALVIPLRNRGFLVLATDLHDWGCPHALAGLDFLQALDAGEARAIITNPPFRIIQPFIERACKLAPYVAIFARLAFLESDARHGWFERMGLARIHIISDRLPMMHRCGYEGPTIEKVGMAFAWFVFDDLKGLLSPTLHWWRWKDSIKRFPMQDEDRPPTPEHTMPLFKESQP